LDAKGKIQRCIWDQHNFRPAHPAELLRLAPDALVVQNYLGDTCLKELREIRNIAARPFIIQTLDDLMTGLAESNPLRVTIPPNSAERIQQSLAYCDRLIVSTDYLAECHAHQIKDIKVVQNRLEQALWLPLHSQKRTSKKPRIGWAGGTTHQDDLMLIEEIIRATRDDADWVFMGMCPESIRPLLAEYHPLVGLADYPAYLASLNFDIAVAPLAETPFNRAKSNLRLLEYGILGIPVVCTDIDPYQNSPACRVKNTPAAWIKALQERIHDPDASEREGIEMREWVLRHYILEDHLDEWLMAHLPN
jgi:glycosyltransferase involved in cell wall biosynthesis